LPLPLRRATLRNKLFSQLPWVQVIRLPQMIKDRAARGFYIQQIEAELADKTQPEDREPETGHE